MIHKNAIVETKSIGVKTNVWAFVHILSGATIGNGCNICDHCFIEGKAVVGDNVTIKSGVYLWDGVCIKNNVFIGPNATFTNDLFPRSGNRSYRQLSTTVESGASIGANATILPGIIIGKWSMVGSGSVVTRNVDDFSLVVGNPARVVGYVCVCGKKITFKENTSICTCTRAYMLKNGKVIEKL